MQSSSLKQIGRPNRMDIDLSAARNPVSQIDSEGIEKRKPKTNRTSPCQREIDARDQQSPNLSKMWPEHLLFLTIEEKRNCDTHHQTIAKRRADVFRIQLDPVLRMTLPRAYAESLQYVQLHRKKHAKWRRGLRRNDRRCH